MLWLRFVSSLLAVFFASLASISVGAGAAPATSASTSAIDAGFPADVLPDGGLGLNAFNWVLPPQRAQVAKMAQGPVKELSALCPTTKGEQASDPCALATTEQLSGPLSVAEVKPPFLEARLLSVHTPRARHQPDGRAIKIAVRTEAGWFASEVGFAGKEGAMSSTVAVLEFSSRSLDDGSVRLVLRTKEQANYGPISDEVEKLRVVGIGASKAPSLSTPIVVRHVSHDGSPQPKEQTSGAQLQNDGSISLTNAKSITLTFP
jgi:hypothetical protein